MHKAEQGGLPQPPASFVFTHPMLTILRVPVFTFLLLQSCWSLGQKTAADSTTPDERLSARPGRFLRSSPYQLRTGREVVLLGAGAISWGVSLQYKEDLMPLTTADVAVLDRQAVNAFDRGATYHWSNPAGQLSNLTWAGTVVAVGGVTLTTHTRPDWKTVGVMYVETAFLANGIEEMVKNFSRRNRPFTYNPAAPLAEKLTQNARQSFFSGHATNAFASAVFASEVFRHYYPDSRLKTLVWIGTLGLATATCVLRYEAGQHYPTDLMAGAAFGSLVGWGIPKLHEVKTRHAALNQLDIQPWRTGSAAGLYVRWTFSSTTFVTR